MQFLVSPKLHLFFTWRVKVMKLSQFFISPGSGVAWVAHVGGFAFGVLIGLLWRAQSTPRAAVSY